MDEVIIVDNNSDDDDGIVYGHRIVDSSLQPCIDNHGNGYIALNIQYGILLALYSCRNNDTMMIMDMALFSSSSSSSSTSNNDTYTTITLLW